MPLVDEDTKKILIKKTWCHGQAICPVYGIIVIWWYFNNELHPLSLIFAGIFLPYWCYLSYKSVFVQFDYQMLLMGGFLAEVSHVIVFRQAMQHLDRPWYMVLFIASILFFIETAAFLGVVTAFRPRGPVPSSSTVATFEDEPPRNWHLDSTSPLV